eukprot:6795212-Prymnesium_polylepis.1
MTEILRRDAASAISLPAPYTCSLSSEPSAARLAYAVSSIVSLRMMTMLSAFARFALACAVASASTPLLTRSAPSRSASKTMRLMANARNSSAEIGSARRRAHSGQCTQQPVPPLVAERAAHAVVVDGALELPSPPVRLARVWAWSGSVRCWLTWTQRDLRSVWPVARMVR